MSTKIKLAFIVSCQGVQLGGPGPGFARGGTTEVGACNSIILTESSCEVEIKNTLLILLSHFRDS